MNRFVRSSGWHEQAAAAGTTGFADVARVGSSLGDDAAYMITTVMSGATGTALGSLIGAAVAWGPARAPRYAQRPVHSSEPSSLDSHRRRGTR
jgi:hypothetical protein